MLVECMVQQRVKGAHVSGVHGTAEGEGAHGVKCMVQQWVRVHGSGVHGSTVGQRCMVEECMVKQWLRLFTVEENRGQHLPLHLPGN